MRLTGVLRALGHDVEHVYTKQLSGHPDPDIMALAQAEQRLLITADRRFADARVFMPGTHAGLLFLRLKHAARNAISAKVQSLFETEAVESWRGCFVVATEVKLRVRCPD